ncbi:cytochrome P450 [Streptomyces sp. NPDC007117]|uniref:cytochrome P450 n=1 Tax=Streptomyces sp. NPDC007117 TaxID=3154314 RepID=UPI0033D9647F
MSRNAFNDPGTSMPKEDQTTVPPTIRWSFDELDELSLDPVIQGCLESPTWRRIQLPHGTEEAWLAGRYADVCEVARDQQRFSREALAGRSVSRTSPHIIPMPGAPSLADTPAHDRLRHAVKSSLHPNRIERLRPRTEAMAHRMLEAMEGSGSPADLMDHFIKPLALAGICDLIGIPEADRESTAAWSELTITARQTFERSEQAKAELGALLDKLAVSRIDDPRDDVLSGLVEAETSGTLSRSELVGVAAQLLTTGYLSWYRTNATMVYIVLTRPDLFARLCVDPEVLPGAVEELLRWMPQRNAVGIPRIATEDVSLGGVEVGEGEPVYVSWLAANRDPAVFERPDELDFDRSPNPHLAFGYGVHHCMGASFARMESQVLLRALTERLPRLHLAVPAHEIKWQLGEVIRGPQTLPVAW